MPIPDRFSFKDFALFVSVKVQIRTTIFMTGDEKVYMLKRFPTFIFLTCVLLSLYFSTCIVI